MSKTAIKKRPARVALEVEVVERRDTPGVWTVEAIDNASEGEIYQALFAGPDAKERAYEYAAMKYGVQ